MNLAQRIDFKSVSVVDVARALFGEENRERSTNAEKHFPGNAGLYVNTRKNRWYSHGNAVGGDALELVRFANGQDFAAAISWLRAHGFVAAGKEKFQAAVQRRRMPPSSPSADAELEASAAFKMEMARRLWREAVPLAGTLGERYFVETRKHPLCRNFDHCLRWHEGIKAIVALMTDAVTNEPTGVHRIFVSPEAQKVERKMLGKSGVIRLSPNSEVTQGLGITEGVEDGLAVLADGWAPVWAATSSGAIGRFPVLAGIEFLTIFADPDPVGLAAAQVCAERWQEAGREYKIINTGE